MNHTFRLKNGEISFEGDKIIISDNAKTLKYFLLASNFFSIICIVITMFNFERLGDKSYNSSFFVMIALILIVLVPTLLLWSTKSTVLLDDVKSIGVKKRFSNTLLDIKLKNNRHRRVMEVQNIEELKDYIQRNFKVN